MRICRETPKKKRTRRTFFFVKLGCFWFVEKQRLLEDREELLAEACAVMPKNVFSYTHDESF
jgi:hypothetical protein